LPEYRQKEISDDAQFKFLVSPLAHDPDRFYTEKVQRAFLGEEGFLAVPICKSFNFDFSTNSQSAWEEMKQRATELINAKHADLLLFGYVSEPGKAVVIYAVNEHGGYDRQPKPTEIKLGVLGSEFTEEEKEKLIEVSLEAIQSACLNQSSIDWPLFAKRMKKMEMFLNQFDFSQPKYLYFASSYIEAMRLLYYNGQNDVWFSKGEEFAKRVINKNQDKNHGTSEALSWVYIQYAVLLCKRFDKTKDKTDLDRAIEDYNEAIGLDPKNALVYGARGDAYSKKGEWDRAIDDFTKAISLDPKDATAYYGARGYAYSNKGDMDRAIDDFTKAISLDPKDATAYYGARGYAYSNKGDMDRAIDDFTKAISLDPKDARATHNRGNAYLHKGDMDRAIDDFTKAIGLDPKDATGYGARGYAYSNKGDMDRAIEDYTKAIGLDPKAATAYGARGEAYGNKGDWDRAIDDFTKAIGLDPKAATAYGARGEAYRNKGDWDHAIEDLTKAIALYPKDKDYYRSGAYGSRATAYLAKGDKKRWFADFRKGMELGGAPQ
jgi:tetratricopeptide (TPR) repeat protein